MLLATPHMSLWETCLRDLMCKVPALWTATKTFGVIMLVSIVCILLHRQTQLRKSIKWVAIAGSSNTPDNGSNILGATPATSSVKDVQGGMSVVPGSVAARVGACPALPAHVCKQLP